MKKNMEYVEPPLEKPPVRMRIRVDALDELKKSGAFDRDLEMANRRLSKIQLETSKFGEATVSVDPVKMEDVECSGELFYLCLFGPLYGLCLLTFFVGG